jgi:hypothetical protein
MLLEQNFLLSCKASNFQLVKSHIEAGVDINFKNSACLLSVISGNGYVREKIAIIDLLLEKGAKLHNTSDSFLTFAVRAGDVYLVKYFLDKNISPNLDEGASLSDAIFNERKEILFHLLKAGGIITKDIINDIQELGHEIPQCLYQVSFLQEYIKDHPLTVQNTSIDNRLRLPTC